MQRTKRRATTMKRRNVLAGIAVATAAVTAALVAASVHAASPTVTRGGTITWACPQSNLTSLDPAVGTRSICQRDAYRAMYDTLVSIDSKDHVTPQAAESWKIDYHNLRYTFQLRKGMRFHDGSPVTSADVKYSILRQLKNPTLGGRDLLTIKRVATPDPLTVRITLFKPNFVLFHYLAATFDMPIVNKKVVEANNNDLTKADAGSGPFMLTDVNVATNGFASFTAFKGYWEKAPDGKSYPYLDGFKLSCIVDANSRILNLRSNTVQLVEQTPIDNIKDLAQAGFREVNNYGGIGSAFVMNEHVSPFDNPFARRAVVEALDRPTIAKTWSNGKATLRVTNIAAGSAYDIKNVDAAKYDPEKAKADLAKAGLPTGFTFTDTIINQSPDLQVSQIIQQYLKAVGITMNIRTLDRATWLTETGLGKTA